MNIDPPSWSFSIKVCHSWVQTILLSKNYCLHSPVCSEKSENLCWLAFGWKWQVNSIIEKVGSQARCHRIWYVLSLQLKTIMVMLFRFWRKKNFKHKSSRRYKDILIAFLFVLTKPLSVPIRISMVSLFYLLLRGLDKLFWSDHLCLSPLLSVTSKLASFLAKHSHAKGWQSLLIKHALQLF